MCCVLVSPIPPAQVRLPEPFRHGYMADAVARIWRIKHIRMNSLPEKMMVQVKHDGTA